MRYLWKLLRRTVALLAVVALGHLLLVWGAARRDYARAEAQVADAIAKGWTSVTLQNVPALRTLPANLGEIDGLTRFQAHDTNLYDLSALAGMTELEYVDVRGSRIADLSPLAGTPKLKHLVINETRVRDLGPLTTLPSLERLGMTFVQVASLHPLTRVSNLNWINLHGAYAEDGSNDHFRRLIETVAEVNNGSAFRQNYVPREDWLWRVRMNRLAEDLGLPEPFPRGA